PLTLTLRSGGFPRILVKFCPLAGLFFLLFKLYMLSCAKTNVMGAKDIVLFKDFSKKRVKKDIADTLRALDAKISILRKESEVPISLFYPYLYCFNKEGSDYKKFVDFLCKNMRYARNDYSVREIFEISISFYRPTLQYKWNLKKNIELKMSRTIAQILNTSGRQKPGSKWLHG